MSSFGHGILVACFALVGCGGTAEPSPATPAATASTEGEQTVAYDPADLPPPDVTRFRVPIEGAPARGAENPLVTLVVFSDFQCPFCSRSAEVLDRLLSKYPEQLRVVFRHSPLPFHPRAVPAAEVSMEARAQQGDEGFWAMHDALFANQRDLSRTALLQRARELGLDVDAVEAALDEERHRSAIASDQAIALGLGVRGTPAHFLNGRPLMGAQPQHRFEEVLRQELALASKLMDTGTPRDEIYAAIMRSAVPARPAAPRPPSRPAPEEAPDPVAVPVGDSPARGPEDALVTIVEFSDFECPFCSRAQPTLAGLRERFGDDLRIVFKHHPLPMHERAMAAHEAAEEARAQKGDEGFWAMHDRLYADIRKLAREDLEAHAEAIGLDMPRFRSALDSHVHRETIEGDLGLARELGVRGTPTFFINGRKLVGARPPPVFEAHVTRALERARELVEQGVPRGDVYRRLTSGDEAGDGG